MAVIVEVRLMVGDAVQVEVSVIVLVGVGDAVLTVKEMHTWLSMLLQQPGFMYMLQSRTAMMM